MTRLRRMEPIQRLAEEREQEAARNFTAARVRLAEQEGRKQQLHDYRGEYSARFQHSGAGGMTPGQLVEYRAFRHQDEVLAKASAEVAAAQQAWMEAIRYRDRLEVMRSRMQREEQHLAERREQRESDERSGRVPRPRLD